MQEESCNVETLVGVAILILLAAIAVGVFLKQLHYSKEVYELPAPQNDPGRSGPPAAGVPAQPQAALPAGIEPLSPPETFGPDSLSDKIDGKAELYLSAGFRSLATQRLTGPGELGAWMEVFVFDMGSGRNAYSVYSQQRRPDARAEQLTRFAYQTANALFFVHGQYYVEIVASTAEMMDEMRAVAQDFVRQYPLASESGSLSELVAFPAEHLQAGSIALHASGVFGFNRLDNTFTAKYLIDGKELTAFLSRRESPQAAAELAAAYQRFLLENGATDASPPAAMPEARLVNVFGFYELIFADGRFLGGVHEAETIESAEKLAVALANELRRTSP